jgi:uncharacterized protein DUF5612
MERVYGKRIIIMGGGAQVGQVALGAITEADRHNIRGEHISVDTIPLVGEKALADAVRAAARLPRVKAIVLAGSLMGGEIEHAVRDVRASGLLVVSLNMAGSVPEAADLVVTDPVQAGVMTVMAVADTPGVLTHCSLGAIRLIRRPVGGRRFDRLRGGLRLAPGVSLPTFLKAREVAAAGGAAVRRRSDSKEKANPGRWMVVLLAPGSQILAVTARAASIFPGSIGPCAGFPTRSATAAAQGIDPYQRPHYLAKGPPMRHAHIACSALGTR